MTHDELWTEAQRAIREKRIEEAVELLTLLVEGDEEQGLVGDEENVPALCYLGICHGQLGHYLEGEHYLSVACELSPELPQAHYNLGRMFELRERLEEAIRNYENALRADRGYTRALDAIKRLGARLSPDLRDLEEPPPAETGDGATDDQPAD